MRTGLTHGWPWAILGICWPLHAVGQLFNDPTRPPDAPPVATPTTTARPPCVAMVMVATGRHMAVINGQRLRLGDSLDQAVVREIAADGVVLEKNGFPVRYPPGNCLATTPPQVRE